MTLTDTGPLVARIDANEAQHEACRQALHQVYAYRLADGSALEVLP